MGAAKSTRREHKQDASNWSGEVHDRIEAERRKLQRAGAVLLALVYSLDHGLDTEQAGDVVSVALDLIEQAVVALDVVALKTPTS